MVGCLFMNSITNNEDGLQINCYEVFVYVRLFIHIISLQY